MLLQRIRDWWWARQRAIDLSILWPECKRLAPDLDHAKAAFAAHAYNDPVWVKAFGNGLFDEIDKLK